jgi:hypothetical protein
MKRNTLSPSSPAPSIADQFDNDYCEVYGAGIDDVLQYAEAVLNIPLTSLPSLLLTRCPSQRDSLIHDDADDDNISICIFATSNRYTAYYTPARTTNAMLQLPGIMGLTRGSFTTVVHTGKVGRTSVAEGIQAARAWRKIRLMIVDAYAVSRSLTTRLDKAFCSVDRGWSCG